MSASTPKQIVFKRFRKLLDFQAYTSIGGFYGSINYNYIFSHELNIHKQEVLLKKIHEPVESSNLQEDWDALHMRALELYQELDKLQQEAVELLKKKAAINHLGISI